MTGVFSSAWGFVIGVWNTALSVAPIVTDAVCKVAKAIQDAGNI